MGAEDFPDFDTDVPLHERPLATSKERAHVRYLSDEPDDAELRRALDMYVLTGAVKIHRERSGAGTHPHHTMLVHEAMEREAHRDAATVINHLWNTGGYYTAGGLQRLRELYHSDVLPVARALTRLPTPDNFDELRADLAEALRRINPPDRNTGPVIVVNSDKDLEKQQESLDFDKRDIWRILVGGNKLARGFTVEGLTVTYYRRATVQVDTLMQMGRWFGFRPGYRDLVRLYTTPDLHAMFEAACLDEDFLRQEMRRYARPSADGRQITPRQVPPLIAQHRPDLRPSARNKMWNAQLAEKSSAGEGLEKVAYPRAAEAIGRNTRRWKPVLVAADRTVQFRVSRGTRTFDARVATVSHRDLLDVLGGLTWLSADTFAPELAWLRGLRPDQLRQWVVMLPQQAKPETKRAILDCGPFTIFPRTRTPTGSFRVISEFPHRHAAFRIAGIDPGTEDPAADALAAGQTAAIIVYPVVEDIATLSGIPGGAIDPEKVTIGFHIITPFSTAPTDGKLIKWRTVDSTNPNAIVVDVADG